MCRGQHGDARTSKRSKGEKKGKQREMREMRWQEYETHEHGENNIAASSFPLWRKKKVKKKTGFRTMKDTKQSGKNSLNATLKEGMTY